MKSTAARLAFAVVFASVIAAAFFGFAIMMNGAGQAVMGCFGPMPGAPCSALGPSGHFEAHSRAFGLMTTAVVRVVSPLAAFAALFLAVIVSDFPKEEPAEERSLPQVLAGAFSPKRIEWLHWFALREKRDPFSCPATNR